MKETKTIAVVIDPDWPVKHHHEVIQGIRDYAEEFRPLSGESGRGGEWVLVNNLFPEEDIERFDGLIGRITADTASAAVKAGIPVVNTLFSSPVADEIPGVYPDYAEGARMAADHLIARGFRSFAHIGFPHPPDRCARDAFKAHLRTCGFRCRSIQVSERYNANGKMWSRFNRRLTNWIDTWAPPIGLFVSHSDPLALHLLANCKRKRLTIPRDVALISGTNEPAFCLLTRPTLTSIDFGYTQVGYRAAALLDDLLKGEQPPAERVILPPAFLEIRESTDAFVVRDPLVAEALRFIANNAHQDIKVDDVARAVGYGRRSLDQRFKECFDKTPAETIKHFQIERLKRLLAQSRRPLKKLAQETGFKDAHMMYTAFHRAEGISPSEYRRRHGNLTGTS